MGAFIDLTGKKIGMLTVLRRDNGNTNSNKTLWVCLCDCGNTKVIPSVYIKHRDKIGKIQSCGCAGEANRLKSVVKHGNCSGNKNTREYMAWQNMIRRCESEYSSEWNRYGARGITVCEEWRNDFATFLSDMGSVPDGFSLDRIDNSGNYEPSNCRWTDKDHQNRNKRTNRWVTFHGKTMILQDLSKLTGIETETLRGRLARGLSPEEAVLIPVRGPYKNNKSYSH